MRKKLLENLKKEVNEIFLFDRGINAEGVKSRVEFFYWILARPSPAESWLSCILPSSLNVLIFPGKCNVNLRERCAF